MWLHELFLHAQKNHIQTHVDPKTPNSKLFFYLLTNGVSAVELLQVHPAVGFLILTSFREPSFCLCVQRIICEKSFRT